MFFSARAARSLFLAIHIHNRYDNTDMKTQNQLHTFTVSLAGPIDIPLSLELFRHWGDDGIDRWDGHRLVRTTRMAGQVVP